MKCSVIFLALLMACRVEADGEEGGDGEGECVDAWPEHCAGRVEKAPRDCYDEGIAKGCCKSCAAIKEDVEGCEYGNKAGWCDSENESDTDCSDSYVVENCCKLCAGAE